MCAHRRGTRMFRAGVRTFAVSICPPDVLLCTSAIGTGAFRVIFCLAFTPEAAGKTPLPGPLLDEEREGFELLNRGGVSAEPRSLPGDKMAALCRDAATPGFGAEGKPAGLPCPFSLLRRWVRCYWSQPVLHNSDCGGWTRQVPPAPFPVLDCSRFRDGLIEWASSGKPCVNFFIA